MSYDDNNIFAKILREEIPCNTAIYFKVREGKLNMTVSNRSNDVIWGTFGANVVHMSILQEYVAYFLVSFL